MDIFTTGEVSQRMKSHEFDPFWNYRLQVDAYRIALRYLYDPISVVAIGKIDPLPHQVEAFIKMMAMLRPSTGIEGRIRMLLADDVGLGKTIMIGLVMKELLLRKRIRRVLIICPSGLQIQWKEEMKDKFNEDFTIIKGPIEGNPYQECSRAIISVDIGRNVEKTRLLLECDWDLVIVDESHRLKPDSLRYESVGKPIAERTRHLILASATPHDGKVDNFLALVQLIDQDIDKSVRSDDLHQYLESKMIRRLKEEIVDFRGKKIFPVRDAPKTLEIDYSAEEREFYDGVEDYVRRYYTSANEKNNYNVMLALYILHRRVSSSLAAGVRSLEHRRNNLLKPFVEEDFVREYTQYAEDGDEQAKEKVEEHILGATLSITSDELREEITQLAVLINLGNKLIDEEKDQKYQSLISLVRGIKSECPNDKIIIFTEFTDTLHFLNDKLEKEGFIVAQIRGGMDPEEKKRQASFFESNAHILLGTEAAGEGLNLQFANIAINYELPWNPNRLEQRIGRVYRYGQKKRVSIYNFKTAFPIDDAVLSKILEKMEEIRKVYKDRAIDVIGSLISEKDVMEIFRLSRTANTAVEDTGKLFDDKLDVFKSIDKFLVKQQFNLVNVKSLSRDLSYCINNFDIERFFLSYAQSAQGIEVGQPDSGKYPIHLLPCSFNNEIPCIDWKSGTYHEMYVQGIFDPSLKGTYVSLGHPLLNAAIDSCLANQVISLIASKEEGVLLTYIIRVKDGLGKEVYAEPLLIKKTATGTCVIDPLEIWNMNPLGTSDPIEVDYRRYTSFIKEARDEADLIMNDQVNQIQSFARIKHDKDLETEFEFSRSELDWKIKQEAQKKSGYIDKGMSWLVQACDTNIARYRDEHRRILFQMGTAKRQYSTQICGPVNIGLLIPEERTSKSHVSTLEERIALEKRKKEIELIGMRAVEKYERDRGRTPKDVSLETVRGYDIYSVSSTEKRFIEVKSFATTGEVEISSNEWRTASQEREDYYLYIVEYTNTIPSITIIRDPYRTISDFVQIKKIEDFHVILNQLPNIQYVERSVLVPIENDASKLNSVLH